MASNIHDVCFFNELISVLLKNQLQFFILIAQEEFPQIPINPKKYNLTYSDNNADS